MHGIASPITTPFTADGGLDEDALRQLVGWLEDRGVHYLVPCGSTSEAELMTADERARVAEVVVDEASVPVIAGCGHPGYRETRAQLEAADAAGADGALVVTPFYYDHDQSTLADYYRRLADEAAIPIHLYSVPAFTDVRLEPDTVGELAAHPTIAGMKDSLGDLGAFVRTAERTADADFDLVTGSANLVTAARDHGAAGAILAVANLAPEVAVAAYDHHDDQQRATEHQTALIELNALTSRYGIPALKWAMRERGAPAGHARSPFQPPDTTATTELRAQLEHLDLIE